MTRECHVRFCERLAVRFRRATHLVADFEHEADARRFWEAMRGRLEEFSLSLHPEKTRLIEPGFAVVRQTAGVSETSQWFTLDRFGACA
jgi:hypothetical protein